MFLVVFGFFSYILYQKRSIMLRGVSARTPCCKIRFGRVLHYLSRRQGGQGERLIYNVKRNAAKQKELYRIDAVLFLLVNEYVNKRREEEELFASKLPLPYGSIFGFHKTFRPGSLKRPSVGEGLALPPLAIKAYASCIAMYVSAMCAATAPSAAAVTTWRSSLVRTSPAANTPSMLVLVLSSATM